MATVSSSPPGAGYSQVHGFHLNAVGMVVPTRALLVLVTGGRVSVLPSLFQTQLHFWVTALCRMAVLDEAVQNNEWVQHFKLPQRYM